MRACCTILLLLLPLAVAANTPKTGEKVQGSGFRVQGSNATPGAAALPPADRPTLPPADRPTVPPSDRLPPATDSWAPSPFARYDAIIERKPFGQTAAATVSAAALAAAAAPPPPPPFATKLTLCAMNRTPSGSIAVGFVDSSATPPHNYYLCVRESENGFNVLSADMDEEQATIEKDGTSVDLKMGKGPVVASAKPTPTEPAPVIVPKTPAAEATPVTSSPPMPMTTSADTTTWPMPRNLKAIDNALKMGIKNDSYIERLKKRREEVLAQQTAATDSGNKALEDKAAATFELVLRRKNLDLIRSGQPGLGIPLTAEEDAQLVTEGALPPQK